ncbi:hypothetical protein GGS24DRAFT_439020 [Hypoxylon argillaceum]|nr:hypothetical protein GGS24DRAFT_439020 [Hypoxylon argillaceum]KAI1157052.1 hypothetical protein F4825DRAFT_286 [Nemania diffusa]
MAPDADTGSRDIDEPPALHPHVQHDNDHESLELSVGEAHPRDSAAPTVSQLMKCKSRGYEGTKSKEMPLTLLDLPVDVLRLIVNELTYTNDLTALALTHSALCKLAVPNIYSRFDIVWPDTSTQAENSKGVDALSYGLATLCLPSRFAETAKRSRGTGFGKSNVSHRLANKNHAKYIRKFSISNGPPQWTSEYMITKESGKMLGTLVAIAVSKMINLENFVWDMPTGVLSDVFMALSSLEDGQGQAKLEKVWIRWHDSSSRTPPSTSGSSPTALPPLMPPPAHLFPGTISHTTNNHAPANIDGTTLQSKSYAQGCAEYPTFSILPPLKSLTVLDIDDLSYLDEMSVLIERSASHLRELRVGISKTVYNDDIFALLWDGANVQQVDHEAAWPGESRIPTTRLGGVLGVLVGRIYDIRRKNIVENNERLVLERKSEVPADMKTLEVVSKEDNTTQLQKSTNNDPTELCLGRKRLDGKLKLETLALERVTLSIAVCLRAIDWSNMTSLTILSCRHYDRLWKALRQQFQPTLSVESDSMRYSLCLKHIYTDRASPALLSFLKETIAPNTMETIFLLDRQATLKPLVTLEQVFKSTVKRHKSSLKKLLIDSSEKKSTELVIPGTLGRWKHWAIRDEFFSYITSGRMTSLRELGMVIDYKDWHPLLQRLPQMANLRSLYFPHMLDHHSNPSLEPKELALQIVDIISLRREIQLAYVGLWHKCFEIAEIKHSNSDRNRSQDNHNQSPHADDADHSEGDSDGEEQTTDDEDEDDDDVLFGVGDGGGGGDDLAEEASDDDQSEADSLIEEAANEPLPRLRLREILYYDEKVELFRARHCKL